MRYVLRGIQVEPILSPSLCFNKGLVMFGYVKKSRYWDILDRGVMSGVPSTLKWHLKDIQDAVAYSYLYDKAGIDIAEIGAGNSRLLQPLAHTNRCYAIDEYEGVGGGPTSRPLLDKVEFIDCIIGNSKGIIEDASFDIIYSVSVVEHVPSNQLSAFFADCRRILKPGGLMVHLIDVYVESENGNNTALWSRMQDYLKPFNEGMFTPLGSIEFRSHSDIGFNPAIATNPDNVMRDWNISSPTLIEKRKVAQSCTLEMAAKRIT